MVSIPDLSLVMNDEGVPSASQRLNFRSCHNLPEWLRSIQSWRGYIPGYEISALIDADDEEPCAAVKSGSMDDRDNVADKRNPAPIRVCVGLPCALAGAEAFCDEITSARSGHRVIRETCMARCWMAPVAAIGDDVISGAIDGGTVNADSDGQAADFEPRNLFLVHECGRIRRSQELPRQATFHREHRFCAVCIAVGLV